MQGLPDPPSQRGVIPRAFEHIFESVQVWVSWREGAGLVFWAGGSPSVATNGPRAPLTRGIDCRMQSEPALTWHGGAEAGSDF